MATMIVRNGTFFWSAAFHSRASRVPRDPFRSSPLTPTACQVLRPDCAHRDPNEYPVARNVPRDGPVSGAAIGLLGGLVTQAPIAASSTSSKVARTNSPCAAMAATGCPPDRLADDGLGRPLMRTVMPSPATGASSPAAIQANADHPVIMKSAQSASP